MPEIVITIVLNVPEGVTATVQYPGYAHPGLDEPPWPAETLPPFNGMAPTTPAAAPIATSSPSCPDHRVLMLHKPAGISKKTGNSYPAFWACPETGCRQTWNPPR